jgi:hypothetical protein
MTLQERIVEEARSWLHTPFRHQGQVKHVGVDCAQFVALVAKGAGLPVEIPANYRPREDGTVMLKLLNEHMEMVPLEEVQPGDVLALCDEALRDPDIPRHLVFVTDVTPKTLFIIHASERGIREHRTDSRWRARIHSAWRLKNAD